MFTFRSLEEFDDDHGTVKLLDGNLHSSVWLTDSVPPVQE
jgi:hypothetical protein